ncbi:MAG: autotransporter assembly complex family protein, partial [Alphaproteobacteria bacterium]
MAPAARRAVAIAVLLLGWMPSGCSWLEAEGLLPSSSDRSGAREEGEATVDGGPRIAYKATLQLSDGTTALRETIEAASTLIGRADDPPASRAVLDRRVADDRRTIEATLRALGYYAGAIEIAVDRDARPIDITITVAPGPQYRIAELAVRAPSGATPLPAGLPPADGFGLAVGAPAASAEIVAAERRIIAMLGERGHPLARVADRRAVVDHAARSMTVTWTIDPGARARFGPVEVRGLENVKERVVRRRIKLREGEVYDTRDVDRTRKAL